ncbi:MAG: TIGR02300 family protein, partial [Alphaproteobacteria bacterium]
MAKPEWGTKRTCPHCGARFYDLRRETIVCPKCDTP